MSRASSARKLKSEDELLTETDSGKEDRASSRLSNSKFKKKNEKPSPRKPQEKLSLEKIEEDLNKS